MMFSKNEWMKETINCALKFLQGLPTNKDLPESIAATSYLFWHGLPEIGIKPYGPDNQPRAEFIGLIMMTNGIQMSDELLKLIVEKVCYRSLKKQRSSPENIERLRQHISSYLADAYAVLSGESDYFFCSRIVPQIKLRLKHIDDWKAAASKLSSYYLRPNNAHDVLSMTIDDVHESIQADMRRQRVFLRNGIQCLLGENDDTFALAYLLWNGCEEIGMKALGSSDDQRRAEIITLVHLMNGGIVDHEFLEQRVLTHVLYRRNPKDAMPQDEQAILRHNVSGFARVTQIIVGNESPDREDELTSVRIRRYREQVREWQNAASKNLNYDELAVDMILPGMVEQQNERRESNLTSLELKRRSKNDRTTNRTNRNQLRNQLPLIQD